MNFAQFIKKMRLEKGWTQSELAKKLGYSNGQFVCNWENERSSVPLKKIPELAKLFGIDGEKMAIEFLRALK